MTDAAGPAAAPDASVAPDVGSAPTVSGGEESASSAAPGIFPATIVPFVLDPDNQDGGTSGTTAAPTVGDKDVAAPNMLPDDSHVVKKVVVSTCLYHVQMVHLLF